LKPQKSILNCYFTKQTSPILVAAYAAAAAAATTTNKSNNAAVANLIFSISCLFRRLPPFEV